MNCQSEVYDLQSKGKPLNLESLTILKVMNDDDPEERVQSMKSLQQLMKRERERERESYKKLAKI